MLKSNNEKIILDLCGGTGSWSTPYAKAGYDVRLVTLPFHDVLTYDPPDNVYGILAAPPCTEFSIAKNHKLIRNLDEGMEIVYACLRIINKANPKFYALENPVGKLKDFLGKPQYTFQPWFFGDGWTKRTMLWGNFIIPKRTFFNWEDVPKIEGLYIRPGRKTPSIAFNHKSHKKFIRAFDDFTAETDADFRAITPPGFANAFYKVNM
jgi:hypothetical protein